ncbi:hypothetical protein PPYR_14532 [Photinus pyralis]|uniref:E3 ubiquitin-protein ligase RNF144B n=1 Tax=Photinus pyralis TaxID=7054 RepID=A0A1Y1MDK5_PHOPY|nr:probable E3 ubiquitin-protein ligase RNF144A-A isoform X1 [Photinus pyralis]XP_031357173.1 probable E3 ubiquitin-protein ligase RNF144A-A isoform X1 [Photinus pyralis]XP_031357174.1 probable E3 ubiquitin-protein ligase RNF144A-A isoform X1 [Photinus pyralis]XP_031357175.1 probable E3 ubiquitin-protein ligase RNF144A-A isoform X1 [Photinus pyralis]KAB0792573.1 hypothetical protein PPYR_14532 [Photinus pyralis]
MTLPIQPLCESKTSCQLRNASSKRKPCLSAVWADPPTRRERRRAICSWSVGYGTLSEREESFGNVAEGSNLLDLKGQRVVSPLAAPHASQQSTRRPRSRVDILAMPGLKSLVSRRRSNGSGSGEIDTAAPLVKKESANIVRSSVSLASLRKCDTVLALTSVLRSGSSSSSIEPLQPVNRLRVSPHGSSSRICSRCSSLLTLASNSRYSLNTATGGFEPVVEESPLLCKLCLAETPSKDACKIVQCNCAFCKQCMRAYVEFEIAEGAYDISCPDAQCPSQGALTEDEIDRLVGKDLLQKHKKYRLNREVELDKNRTWCPRAGCETVCTLCPSQPCLPQCVHCPTCTVDFCSNCKLEWHSGVSCEQNSKRLAKEGKVEDPGISFNSDFIKCCPMCNVPIEKDEGCAQMMCKRCKHVFCWYCLASLDDDFLLRHYDKGPCKNKLGHSRASVIWHRTQVIGIFAGFGILLLVASPLLLLAAPCIVCCKCRFCNAGTSKLDNEEELPEENR